MSIGPQSPFAYFGWRFDLEDRGFLARGGVTFTAPAGFRAPRVIDPRGRGVHNENQGPMGSCGGHGMTTAAEVDLFFESQGRSTQQLSRIFAYYMGQKIAGISGDSGVTISAVVQSAMQNGLPREETMPYPNPVVYDPSNIPEEAIREALQHKILHHSKLQNYEDCFNYLGSGGGGIVIGIPWTEEFAQNRSGRLDQSRGRRLGGHCVAIVGYVEEADEAGRQYLILANSHGEQWGDRGTAIIAPRIFDEWGRDGFSELIGVTGLSDYGQGPRRTVFLGNSPW